MSLGGLKSAKRLLHLGGCDNTRKMEDFTIY